MTVKEWYIIDEVWKDIPGFEGYYQCTIDGKVRVGEKNKARSRYVTEDGLLIPFISPDNSEKYRFNKGSFSTIVDKNNIIKATFDQLVKDLDGEVWKPIINHENYMISNKGRFKKIFKQVKNPDYMYEQLMTPYTNSYGYYMVTIWEHQKRIQLQLHVLVAKYFIPNPDPETLIEVDHIDTILSHNYVENLRWCTHQENNANPLTMQHRLETFNKNRNKKVYMFQNGNLIQIFNRVAEITKQYPELKTKPIYNFIDKDKPYKGYTFKYV